MLSKERRKLILEGKDPEFEVKYYPELFERRIERRMPLGATEKPAGAFSEDGS